MNTLALELLEVNSAESKDVILADDWVMGEEQLAVMAADHEAEAVWDRACECGHGAW